MAGSDSAMRISWTVSCSLFLFQDFSAATIQYPMQGCVHIRFQRDEDNPGTVFCWIQYVQSKWDSCGHHNKCTFLINVWCRNPISMKYGSAKHGSGLSSSRWESNMNTSLHGIAESSQRKNLETEKDYKILFKNIRIWITTASTEDELNRIKQLISDTDECRINLFEANPESSDQNYRIFNQAEIGASQLIILKQWERT